MTTKQTTLATPPTTKREIVNILNTVYVATGYDISFMSLIDGPEGIVLVDSGANPKAASALLAEFRKISSKPLKAIILTHSHPDHTGGLPGIIGMEKELHPDFDPDKLEIWSRANWGTEFEAARLLPNIFQKRTLRQAGVWLSPEQKGQSAAPAPFPDASRAWPVTQGSFPPNHSFAGDKQLLDIAGLQLEMYAAPGETADHLFLWLPQQRIGFCGDNSFCTFPNLYAIRGTPYRDVAAWIQSLKMIYKFHPDYLVMGHSAPLRDVKSCDTWIGEQAEAIEHVLQATLKGMDQGLSPDELAQQIELPQHLADRVYLQEFYGNVAWAVRGIFDGYLGWFDGEARKLTPLSPQEEAEHMAEMAGGAEALRQRAQQALHKKDWAWAAQLASHLLRLDPQDASAKSILAEALDKMADTLQASTGRFYMKSCAQELRN